MKLFEINTSFGKIMNIPAPSLIETAGQWYFLSHISSPLIEFDNVKGNFSPLIAKNWSIQDNSITFEIDDNAFFSDGTKITPKDVEYTLKSIIIRKTSTHFALWELIDGCENITTLTEKCHGIEIIDGSKIRINLKHKSESFILNISSPETAIWSHEDLSDSGLNENIKRYSGPYSISKQNKQGEFILKKNRYSLLQKKYTNSPDVINIEALPRDEIEKRLVAGTLDIFIGDKIPFNNYNWEKMERFGIHYSTPSSILYLYKLKRNSDKSLKVGSDFLASLWQNADDTNLYAAEAFLPFSHQFSISKSDYIENLPHESVKKLRIAAPDVYFKEKFLSLIVSAGKSIGISITFDRVDIAEYFSLFNENDASKIKWDFILGTYVASERYPVVQLRFISNNNTGDFDLNALDFPDNDTNKISGIKNFQKWLIKTQQVLPLYFVRSHIVYNKSKFDLGEQPTTDAEIQLWKLSRKE